MKILRISKNEFKEKYPLKEVLQGAEPTVNTTVSMRYTKDTLHIRMECQANKPLVAEYQGTCVPVWKGDVGEVFISPYGSEEWYYELDVAPNGATFHARIYNPDDTCGYGRCLADDALVTRAEIVDGGWVAEWDIPFALLVKEEDLARIQDLPWRGNVYRINAGDNEYYSFAPTKREQINFHVPSAFAKWEFE